LDPTDHEVLRARFVGFEFFGHGGVGFGFGEKGAQVSRGLGSCEHLGELLEERGHSSIGFDAEGEALGVDASAVS